MQLDRPNRLNKLNRPKNMTTRRQGREVALQVLYALDIVGGDPCQTLRIFWQVFEPNVEAREFTNELVEGTWRERERIDKLIADAAENWRLGRLPKVDLGLLRLGVYELLAYPQLSPGVTINEAIEVARRYCSDEAPTFVNGILDHIATVIGKKARPQEPTA
jgi:N utilization substance protein B